MSCNAFKYVYSVVVAESFWVVENKAGLLLNKAGLLQNTRYLLTAYDLSESDFLVDGYAVAHHETHEFYKILSSHIFCVPLHSALSHNKKRCLNQREKTGSII